MTTKQIDDGGPAFPNVWEDNPSQGMSLRDWHAGMAMQGTRPSSIQKRARNGILAVDASRIGAPVLCHRRCDDRGAGGLTC